MHPFTLTFLAALLLTTAVRLWLARRHIRHIAACRGSVPQEFSEGITLASHQKAADYTTARARVGMLETAVGAVLLLAFTLGGGLQLISAGAARLFETGGYAHGIAFVAGVIVVGAVVDLPFDLYRTFVVEARFGFNRMTAWLYAADLAKQALIAVALGAPLLLLVLWLMAGMGEAWWLYVWATWILFNLLVVSIYPTLIAPLFNRFTPLQDEALKERIERLLAKSGFRARGLFVMDGSRRSAHGNAYFAGFGEAKRIVLFDTLLSRLEPQEIEAVLAHELGHFRLRHVWKRLTVMFTVSFGFLWLLGQLIGQDWFYASLNAGPATTAMALVLFVMVVPVFAFLLQPLAAMYSRRHEFEADAYAARHADPGDLVRALVKLYQDNASTLTPDPLHSAVFDSHPPAAVRIARLQEMKAE